MEERRRHLSLMVGGILVLLLALLGAGGMWLRRHRHEEAQRKQRIERAQAGQRVRVVPVRWAPAERETTLPGDVRGFYQTTVYAKVAGYLEHVAVERGDAVKKGQLLARIRSPETDQDVLAARADVLVRGSRYRARALAPPGVVTRQDLDVANGSLLASEATLRRAQALQSYEKVTAPFDGVVTARYADEGALLPAATGTTQAALPLVDLTDARKLRVTVYVGQDVASFLREGDSVSIVDPQRPTRTVQAQVSRLSAALDPRSRTMLCEIWVDNHALDLNPGIFVHVTLHLRVPPAPTVPRKRSSFATASSWSRGSSTESWRSSRWRPGSTTARLCSWCRMRFRWEIGWRSMCRRSWRMGRR